MSGRIAYAYQDGVATITMNDGKVNILSTGPNRMRPLSCCNPRDRVFFPPGLT